MSHHFNSNSSQFQNVTLLGKPASKKTSPPITISKMIFITLVLGGVALTAILRGFDGLIDIKLGLEGGQVVIDGRKPALLPPITDSSSTK